MYTKTSTILKMKTENVKIRFRSDEKIKNKSKY